MKLNKEERNTLTNWGYIEDDISQIERAIDVTIYELYKSEKPYKTIKLLSPKEAKELLGTDEFLSGIGRSAFHCTASRQVDEKRSVMFDSHKLFR